MTVPALRVTGLEVDYADRRRRRAPVLHGVDLDLLPGTTHALVGQSGSGKSTLALAAIGLLPDNARVRSGQIQVEGAVVDQAGFRALRGATIGYVPQDPLSSLDPLQRVGTQLAALVRRHESGLSAADARAHAVQLLDEVEITDAAHRFFSYPHELSGGQLQRVLIALAMATRPRILIADEPTSALDVSVQKVILDLLQRLQSDRDLSVLLITHDLALAGERSDEMTVLERGRVRDQGPTPVVLEQPDSEYTAQLLRDVPALAVDKFRTPHSHPFVSVIAQKPPLLEVRDLGKSYPHPDRDIRSVRVLHEVSLDVRRESTHAIVGESGSGKTTIARIFASLTRADSGRIVFDGREVGLDAPRLVGPRSLQLVAQNPLAVLDPRMTVAQLIEEPLRLHTRAGREGRAARVREVIDRLHLATEISARRPHELSGGQRQRVAIGRAIVLAPSLLVLDEPTSALDVTVQARIIELLQEIKKTENLTFVFITHDLGLVRQIADDVTVLRNGEVVETGFVHEVLVHPSHPYTRALVDAVPGAPASSRTF